MIHQSLPGYILWNKKVCLPRLSSLGKLVPLIMREALCKPQTISTSSGTRSLYPPVSIFSPLWLCLTKFHLEFHSQNSQLQTYCSLHRFWLDSMWEKCFQLSFSCFQRVVNLWQIKGIDEILWVLHWPGSYLLWKIPKVWEEGKNSFCAYFS